MIIIYTFYGETIGEGDIILSKSIKVIKETMFSYQHSKEARSMKITGLSLYYIIKTALVFVLCEQKSAEVYIECIYRKQYFNLPHLIAINYNITIYQIIAIQYNSTISKLKLTI